MSKQPLYKKIIKSQALRFKVLALLDFVPDKIMVRLQYFIYFGRFLKLKEPVRFSEKLQWYKINYRDPIMTQCVDKVEVREFVKDCGLEHILTKQYAVYNTVSDVNFDMLPPSFVAKYNNGAQRNLIVPDKTQINSPLFNNKINEWLENPTTKPAGREWAYNNVKGKVLVEEYLKTNNADGLIDYKFFCFNGEPRFLYVIKDRFKSTPLKLGIYDMNFNKLIATRADIIPLDIDLEKPKGFDEMIEIAKVLSKSFPHVRVDLYNIDGRIVFGELTFYDACGYMKYNPDSFDFTVGEMFELPSRLY